MKKLWNKSWFRKLFYFVFFLIVFLGLQIFKSYQFIYQSMTEAKITQEIHQKLSAENVAKNCPQEKYSSHYECFIRIGNPAQVISMSEVGFMLIVAEGLLHIVEDKNKKKCDLKYCMLDLLEFNITMLKYFISGRRPMQWSPILVDQIKRVIDDKYVTTMSSSINQIINQVDKKRDIASEDEIFSKRYTAIKSDWLELQPKLEPLKVGFVLRWVITRLKLNKTATNKINEMPKFEFTENP